MTTGRPAAGPRILFGIALLCCANVLLEIFMVRLFSAMMFYHFTFMAVALALFGLAAGGVYVYVRRDTLARVEPGALLERHSLLFAGSIVALLLYAVSNPVEFPVPPAEIGGLTGATLLQICALLCISAVPFFFGGVVVAAAMSRFHADVNRVYAYDLAGAALAAGGAGFLLEWLGGPSAIFFAALLAASAALLFGAGSWRAWAGAAATGLILASNAAWSLLTVPSVKTVEAGRVVFEKWNIFSRITVERVLWDGGRPGYDIKIDSAASTPLMAASAIREIVNPLSDFAAIGHALFPGGAPRVLVIGPGGGRDIVHALAAGSRHVTGVDVNGIIVNTVMQERFRDATGDLYRDPRIRIVVAEGRSYIRRSAERFDVLQLSMVDTWAATASGAFALSENTLYTAEAFRDYFAHLTRDGIATSSRWWGPETARLTAVAAEGLRRSGVSSADVGRHLYVLRKSYPAKNEDFGTLIAKRTPLTDEDLRKLDRVAAREGFETVLAPHRTGKYGFEALVGRAGAEVAPYPAHDLAAPTDDRPFFFYFVPARDFWSLRFLSGSTPAQPALWILLGTAAALAVLVALFIVLPLTGGFAAARGLAGMEAAPLAPALGYFGAVGFGFMLVEFGLMQKLTVFLGHPSYALLVVLFGLLVSTAVGARSSAGFASPRDAVRRTRSAGWGVVLLCAAFALGADLVLDAWIGWELGSRVLLALAIVSAFGLLMGNMVPAGIVLVAARAPAIIPWCWGMNGAASVLATVASLLISLHLGISATLAAGAVLYLLAMDLARRLPGASRDQSP